LRGNGRNGWSLYGLARRYEIPVAQMAEELGERWPQLEVA
jgi:hypothetical protein